LPSPDYRVGRSRKCRGDEIRNGLRLRGEHIAYRRGGALDYVVYALAMRELVKLDLRRRENELRRIATAAQNMPTEGALGGRAEAEARGPSDSATTPVEQIRLKARTMDLPKKLKQDAIAEASVATGAC
jgi:hypothetical protein